MNPRKRVGRRRSIAALAAIVTLIATPAAATAATAAGDQAPIAGLAELAGPEDLRGFADDLVAGIDPSVHGGVAVDIANRTVTLMVVRGRSEAALNARASVIKSPIGATVRTKLVDRDTVQLEQLRDTGVWSKLSAELADHVTYTQIDVERNQVVVGLDEVTPGARRQLKKLFGDAVAVRHGQRMTAMNRYNDGAPFYAGDRLMFSNNSFSPPYRWGCTGGFPATYQGREVMVTAGHCAPYGSATTPTYVAVGGREGENGCMLDDGCWAENFGRVWQTRLRAYPSKPEALANPPTVDLALITTTTLPFTWQAGSNTQTISLVSYPGADRTPTGVVCTSGATSLGYCGFTVEAGIKTLGPVPVGGGGWAMMQAWHARGTAQTRVCPGDSGGTVYSRFGAGASVIGVVTGSTSLPGECGNDLYFTHWGQGRPYFPNYVPLILA